ncbi:DUF1870 family protein [Mannheimia sp. AT1]|uniref:DUF1870 family protein n=1 Tax=Mannheimia cairinae TaxID=3025936 RepID=A0ABT5MR64_9PAST|nr:DUF1870 family protein [Mannheimia cairinae]MDD0824680.1 DUF1870 family protein [Mannheimia cairinae]MDD0826391.1 DUF1870 family protein [Mannheimia cairinae]
MTGIELKAARLIFGLSQAEAAEEIGKVNKRSWSYWEQGQRTIPQDVVNDIKELLSRRKQTLDMVKGMVAKTTSKLAVIFYDNPQDAGMSLLEVRYNNALAVQLHFDYGASLVKFEPESYINWLAENGLIDSPQKRSEWAAYKGG